MSRQHSAEGAVLEPTVFIEKRVHPERPSNGHYSIVLYVGDEATIATVHLTVRDDASEREAVAAELNRILNPDVMDAMVSKGLIEFKAKVPLAPPVPDLFYKPHDLAFALMRATSSRGCISLVSRSEWKASQA